MCIIYSCHDKLPTHKELEAGARNNTDGAGIMWLDKSKGHNKFVTRWVKGLKSNATDVLDEITKRKIKFPVAIHYRSASIGPRCDELTHPFPVEMDESLAIEGSTRKVLMHNGHIGDWKTWLFQALMAQNIEFPLGPWSDSRAVAIAVHLKGEGLIDFIEDRSRILIMDSIPSQGCDAKDADSYLRMFGSGWCKNTGFWTSCTIPQENYYEANKKWENTRNHNIHKKNDKNNKVITLKPVEKPKDVAIYTVEELEIIVTALRDEQRSAQLTLGTE